jgi:hypothetical protein
MQQVHRRKKCSQSCGYCDNNSPDFHISRSPVVCCLLARTPCHRGRENSNKRLT